MSNDELSVLRAMNNKRLVQHYKDYLYEFKHVLSIGRYENWYLGLVEGEMERRGLL
jgi:hypothetical protein